MSRMPMAFSQVLERFLWVATSWMAPFSIMSWVRVAMRWRSSSRSQSRRRPRRCFSDSWLLASQSVLSSDMGFPERRQISRARVT